MQVLWKILVTAAFTHNGEAQKVSLQGTGKENQSPSPPTSSNMNYKVPKTLQANSDSLLLMEGYRHGRCTTQPHWLHQPRALSCPGNSPPSPLQGSINSLHPGKPSELFQSDLFILNIWFLQDGIQGYCVYVPPRRDTVIGSVPM